ncbi:methyltransferase domain-containing protein [Candidatus Shapirobacteria bacterium]|nr:methyltransferase domain-containing protein [Candidatus Shapirobacteria bacterium]
MKYTGDNVLDTMANCAINRNNSIYNLIVKYFNINNLSKPKSILEFGAGRGEFINRFLKFKNLTTFATELDKSYLKLLQQKHKSYIDLIQITQKIDYIFANDVLEHNKNDTEILIQMFQKLTTGGRLFIYVPARPELYSIFDKNIGHYRRYTIKDLRSKAIKAGFTIQKIQYHDFLGYFAAVFNKFTSNGELNPSAVHFYDKQLFPISQFIEKLFPVPIGKSIMMVAIKK